MKQYKWKVWLRPGHLTKDVNNDYLAEVSATGTTQHNEDIAREIVKERSEIRYETILSILNERDSIARRLLMQGTPVQDGNVRLAPHVQGLFTGSDPVIDPLVHKPTLIATLTADMRKALLNEISIKILGKKVDGGAAIGLVTDMYSGKTDGDITVGGDIIIAGEKLKIFPTNDKNMGVFFTDASGNVLPLDYPIIENRPRRIICRLPATVTEGGVYTLKIVTQYSKNLFPLKSSRTIEYEFPLTAIKPA